MRAVSGFPCEKTDMKREKWGLGVNFSVCYN